MPEFIICYFKSEGVKTQSHKEFKLCDFPSLRLLRLKYKLFFTASLHLKRPENGMWKNIM